jgi:hypothetical protein
MERHITSTSDRSNNRKQAKNYALAVNENKTKQMQNHRIAINYI